MIHFLWIVLIVSVYVISPKGSLKQRAFIRASFSYWAMIDIALFIVNAEMITNSAEGKTFILNLFLLYVFLQHVIDLEFFVRMKNKAYYWFR
jgi:uncharacterized membrane protein